MAGERFDFIRFNKSDIEAIKEQVKKDVELFREYKLMDYSLLLAIELVKKSARKTLADRDGSRGANQFYSHPDSIVDQTNSFN